MRRSVRAQGRGDAVIQLHKRRLSFIQGRRASDAGEGERSRIRAAVPRRKHGAAMEFQPVAADPREGVVGFESRRIKNGFSCIS